MSNNDVIDRGMRCLLDNLGPVETAQFISCVIRENIDYTEWRRRRYDNIPTNNNIYTTVATREELKYIYIPESIKGQNFKVTLTPISEEEMDNMQFESLKGIVGHELTLDEVRRERLSDRLKVLSETELVNELTESIKISDAGHTNSMREVSEEMRAKYIR